MIITLYVKRREFYALTSTNIMLIVLTTLLTCTLDICVFKYHDGTDSINDLYFLAALSIRISAVVSWLLIASLHSSRCSINYSVS